MKKILSLLFLFTISVLCFAQKVKSNSDYSFYENKGQIIDQKGKQNSEVKYLYIANGLNVQIKKSGFSYDVYESERKEVPTSKNTFDKISQKEKPQFKTSQKFHRVDIDFVNANSNVEIVAEEKSADYDNYYNIPDVPKGITNVHRYKKVTYKNLYPNIDLEFFKPSDTLKPVEYNFILKPGGKISNIQLKFNGAKTELKAGKLSMKLRFGEMQENIPKSWIEDINSKKDIKITFKETGNQTFGFESSQDTFDKTVVIDPTPTRIWGSYIGGNNTDYLSRPFIDKFQNIYLTGSTFSSNNFATSGTYQNINFGRGDGFVTKVNKDGKKLWGSFIGGINYDDTTCCSIDEKLNIYSVTVSESFPADPNIHNNITKLNILFLKLDKDGNFIYQKIIGGSDYDTARSIIVDEQDQKIYLSGATRSEDFPTKNAFQPVKGNDSRSIDTFLMKLDYNGNIEWSTFYGGNSSDDTYSMYQDEDKNICVTLITASSNLSVTPDAYQSSFMGNRDGAFVTFSRTGKLLYATYLGEENENLYVFSARKFGDELIFGGKKFLPFPDSERFIKKVNLITKTTIWEKKYNLYNNLGANIYIDNSGNTYFTDTTGIQDLATPDAYQKTIYPGVPADLVMIKLNFSGNIDWATYFGGENIELYGDVVKDDYNYLYLTGFTYSSSQGIGTLNVFQPNIAESTYGDGFIEKFADCISNVNVSFTPTCINNDLKLNASGGDTYEWFGPNNFHSFLQNPVIKNAQLSDSGEYFVRMTGAQTCGGIFTLNIKVGSPGPPVFDIQNLPDILGNCTVILKPPTATDGCGNKITATTKNPLQYSIPGTYIVVWDYDDGNGNISHQNQNIIISSPALPTANATQEFCASNNPTISNLLIDGKNITWYDAAGIVLVQNFKLINGDFYASQNISGCESDKIKVTVKINSTPLPTGNVNQDFCASQSAKISNLKVTGSNLKFYDSTGNLLPTSTLLLDNTSYFVTQTTNSCESEKLEIKVVISQNALPANDFSLSICNETTANSKTEDLTKYEENLITNSLSYIFEYFDQNQVSITDFKSRTISIGNNNFYVKVSTKDGCFKLVKLMLQLNAKPEINLPESTEFCNGLSVELDAGNNPNYIYLWNTGEKTSKIIVNKEGTYSVKVSTPFSCENTASIVVKKSILADILKVEITNNNATIILSATGNFLYSLDNITFQTSNEFKNLNNGNYTLYVKTQQGCIIGEMKFSIFNVTNSFTPNGDGKNDTWKISGLENYPNSEVSVYDASGKRVFYKITSGSFEWDGKLNSRNLPTATYWYTIKVSDGRILTGYLLLKNRN